MIHKARLVYFLQLTLCTLPKKAVSGFGRLALLLDERAKNANSLSSGTNTGKT